MKSRYKELLEKSIAAMVSAIEIYNKPDFLYREETFAVLAINSWELLFKAKWLQMNANKLTSLFVYEYKVKKDGSKSNTKKVKNTRSGNPLTHGLDYIAKKLLQAGELDNVAWANIEILMEVRDSSIHFYNRTGFFSLRLQEVGSATLKNYVELIYDWFNKDLSKYNFYLMPLAFMSTPIVFDGVSLNKEEKNFIDYVEGLESNNALHDDKFSVAVSIKVDFTRSKSKDAAAVRITKDANATPVRWTEEDIRIKFCWDYYNLTEECKKRYKDFKIVKKYHEIRKSLSSNQNLYNTRLLDPGNPKSQKKDFYSPNILEEFDKHYTKKRS
jgi:Protein of unknown function (DUF3644)/EC042_2821-lke REase